MVEGPLASRFRRRVVIALLIAYAMLVLVITLSPRMPGSGFVSRAVSFVLGVLHRRGLFESVDFLVVEFLGNIVMFTPLGFLLALLVSRRHWWVLLITGTLFSALIEFTQLALLPDRFPEVRDLASNSIGFLLGAAAALLLRLLIAHRDRLVERDRTAASPTGAA